MARASRWQLVRVDEKSFVGIARVERQHTLVDVLLKAFAVEARRQGTTCCFWEETRLDALGLRVVGHVLDDDAPFAVDVLGAHGSRVGHFGRADETLTTDPVALIELLSVVERVIEGFLLLLADALDQIVSRLMGHVSVFLQRQRIVVDGVLQ